MEVPRHCAAVREAVFYAEISPPLKNPISPRCFDAGGRFDDGEAYLILEDISESHLLLDKADVPSPYGGWASFETVTPEQFAAIVEALAGFQSHWWNHPRISVADLSSSTGDMLSAVTTASASFLEQTLTKDWEKSVVERLAECGEPDAEAAMRLMRDAILAWPGLFEERFARGHLTLMHGDLHLRNVFFPASKKLEPLVVDWEGLTTGVGIVDVAHLLAASMLSDTYVAELEEDLLKRYHDTLTNNGVGSYSLDDCYDDYRLAIVALVPQAWDGSPFTRSVLTLFRRHHCDRLIR